MTARRDAAPATQTREERIEAIMKELRPKIEATVRRLVERTGKRGQVRFLRNLT